MQVIDAIGEAQADMRAAYGGGATGAIASATAWLAAGIAATVASPTAGVVTLVVGGMLIFPVSVLLAKAVGESGRHRPGNPLAPLAVQGTIWMLACIVVAIGLATQRVEWFFPAMLLVIGGRYLTFVTLYGMRIYGLFGSVLIGAAALLVVLEVPVAVGAFAGAAIEFAFGVAIFVLVRRSPVP